MRTPGNDENFWRDKATEYEKNENRTKKIKEIRITTQFEMKMNVV